MTIVICPIFVRSLMLVGHWARGGVFSKTTSLPLPSQCGLFIFCCRGAVQLAFRSFSERALLYVAVDLACPWQKGSSGSSDASSLRTC